jgi:hypothetical protein
MSNSALSNVLLPAVFVSGVIFSALTVPLALIKSEPVVVELPSLGSMDIPPVEIPPVFDGDHKEVAIPYIGFAIFISVGGGMATVEVYRRWQQWQESAITEKEQESSNQKPQELNSETQPEGIEQPEYRPEVSAIDLSPNEVFNSPSLTIPNSILSSVDEKIEGEEQWIDSEVTIPHTSVSAEPNLPSVEENPNVVQFDPYREMADISFSDFNDSESDESHQPEAETVASHHSAQNTILTSRSEYKTCRIELPHLKRRLLAIQVNGEYYSFLRMEPTQQQILEVLARLGARLPETLITKTEKSYVIWAKVNYPDLA